MLKCGASSVVITPETTQFLSGYPHVERYSKGKDTELMSSSMYLDDGANCQLFIANDLIFLEKALVAEIRAGIEDRTSVPAENIMVTCTHTHSGPITTKPIGSVDNEMPPPPDKEYLNWMKQKVISCALEAVENAEPAELGMGFADSSHVGGNRRHPDGQKNSRVPVLTARSTANGAPVAVMPIVCVHPTVLHQDSKLFSADFPGYARLTVQNKLGNIPVVYHSGPSGNQSPRYLARENTVGEAKRLGEILGNSILSAVESAVYPDSVNLNSVSGFLDLPLNNFPSVEEAAKIEKQAREKQGKMRAAGDDPKATRTAECDWFGAERRLKLAVEFNSGKLQEKIRGHLPVEVQIFVVGPWKFIGLPGEIFVEYGLEIIREFPDTYVIAYANGYTLGYLVTAEAVAEGAYEARSAIFKSPESPELLVNISCHLLKGALSKSFQNPSRLYDILPLT